MWGILAGSAVLRMTLARRHASRPAQRRIFCFWTGWSTMATDVVPALCGERLHTGQRRLETQRYGAIPYARFGTLFFHSWMTQRRGHEGWGMWETDADAMDAVLQSRSRWG